MSPIDSTGKVQPEKVPVNKQFAGDDRLYGLGLAELVEALNKLVDRVDKLEKK